eukprot:COSAG02_NODE_53536_length_301_cov_0.757426_1_plen_21_part_10
MDVVTIAAALQTACGRPASSS